MLLTLVILIALVLVVSWDVLLDDDLMRSNPIQSPKIPDPAAAPVPPEIAPVPFVRFFA